MLKTTSIASVIGLLELTGTAEVYGSQNFVIFELLIVATVWYLLLTTIWGYFQSWIENRLDPNRIIKTELAPEGLGGACVRLWFWFGEHARRRYAGRWALASNGGKQYEC